MNSDKYSAYCREHIKEFRDELRDEASQALTSWPGKSAAILLAVSSVMTYMTRSGNDSPLAFQALFAYAVPILLIFLFPIASLLNSRIEKYSRVVLDLASLTVLLGFCLTLRFVFEPGMVIDQQ